MAIGLGQSKHDYLQHDQLVARTIVGVYVHRWWPEGRFVQGQAGQSVQRHASRTETRSGGGQTERPRETPSASGQLGVRQTPKSRSSRRKQVSATPLYIFTYIYVSRANWAVWNINRFRFRLTVLFSSQYFRCKTQWQCEHFYRIIKVICFHSPLKNKNYYPDILQLLNIGRYVVIYYDKRL